MWGTQSIERRLGLLGCHNLRVSHRYQRVVETAVCTFTIFWAFCWFPPAKLHDVTHNKILILKLYLVEKCNVEGVQAVTVSVDTNVHIN
jgi:hypothetical protein